MRRFAPLLCVLLAHCSEMPWDGPSEDSLRLTERVTGIWIQDSIEWDVETDSILAWRATLLSLAFHGDGQLSLQTRGIYHGDRDSIVFDTVADRIGYSGRWSTVDSTTTAIEYRLTWSDVRSPARKIPGDLVRDTLRLSGDRLLGIRFAHDTNARRAYRLRRPALMSREAMRVLTWRDSIARRRR